MGKIPKKILDALTMSIPLLIMLLLAFISWWMLLITPEPPKVVTERSLGEKPDLIVSDFIAERFDESGALRSNMFGIRAQRFPYNDSILVDGVNLMTTENADNADKKQPVLGTEGVEFYRITAIAEQGVILNEISTIELLKNAYVTRQSLSAKGNAEKLEFRGDELKILIKEEKLISNLPVDIKQDGTHYVSEKMVYHNATDTLEMIGKVSGKIARE